MKSRLGEILQAAAVVHNLRIDGSCFVGDAFRCNDKHYTALWCIAKQIKHDNNNKKSR